MSRKPPSSKPSRPAPKPAAADALDAAVHHILQSLKQGHSVKLPGLGTLRPGTSRRGVAFDALDALKTSEHKAKEKH